MNRHDISRRISNVELQQILNGVDKKKPAQRLLAAVANKNGVTQTKLAELRGVQRRTIYNWLKRFEHAPLVQAVQDDHRSGRSRKFPDEQQNN